MLKTFATPLIIATLIAGAAHAAGKVELTDENTAQIRELLTEQGYEVAKVKIEDGKYEAYAKKDGEKFEVFLDGDFAIVEVRED